MRLVAANKYLFADCGLEENQFMASQKFYLGLTEDIENK